MGRSGSAEEFAGGVPRIASLARSWLPHVETLTDRLMVEIARLPSYRSRRVPPEVVRESATMTWRLMLRSLIGEPCEAELVALCQQVGSDRARRRVALEDLLQAVRLDFRLLWAALLERAGPDDLPELVRSPFQVWEIAEKHTMSVVEAYQATVREMAREREDVRQAAFALLLDGGGADPEIVARTAESLHVDEQGRFCVVVARPGAGRALSCAAKQIRGRGVITHLHLSTAGDLLLVELPPTRADVPLSWLAGTACVVSTVARGLGQVPETARLALLGVRALGSGASGPIRVEQLWLELVLAQAQPLVPHLVRHVLGALTSLDGEERERMLDTIRTQLTGSGSIAEIAGELYCHRNTVINRIHRFCEVTGFDTRRPRDAAVVLLALRGIDIPALGATPPWASAH